MVRIRFFLLKSAVESFIKSFVKIKSVINKVFHGFTVYSSQIFSRLIFQKILEKLTAEKSVVNLRFPRFIFFSQG